MEYNLILKNESIKFTSKHTDKDKVFSSLKRSIGRKHINLLLLLKNNGYDIKVCNVCKSKLVYPKNIIVKLDKDKCYIDCISYGKYLYCGCLNGSLNPNSVDFISKTYNVNDDEAMCILKKKNSSLFYKENHETIELYKKSQSRNLVWYKNNFGDVEGERKFKRFIKIVTESGKNTTGKIKDSSSLEFFIKKYGKEEGIIKFNKKCELSKNTLNSFICRYGGKIGKIKYKEYCQKLSDRMSITWYIERFGTKEGTLKWKELCKKYRITIDNLIKKYGKKKGEKKYKKWLVGITKNRNQKFGYSNESIYFLDKLINLIKGFNFTYKYKTDEYFIYDKEKHKIFFYDFYIKELNLLIEYDTPFYHPNPFKMNESEFLNWKNPFIDFSATEKWNNDLYKQNLTKKHNYNFYLVYLKNKKDIDKQLQKLYYYIVKLNGEINGI